MSLLLNSCRRSAPSVVVGAHSRLFRTSSSLSRERQFRPFPEAREWARSQGLGSAKAWQALPKPSCIPAHPELTYRDEYIDLYDWLDYKKTPRHNRQGRGSDPPLKQAERCPNFAKHADTVDFVIDKLCSAGIGLEVMRMPRGCGANILFRLKINSAPAGLMGGVSRKEWGGISVRTGTVQDGWIRFNGLTSPNLTQHLPLVCFEPLSQRLFFFPPNSVSVVKIGISADRNKRGKYREFEVDNGHALMERLLDEASFSSSSLMTKGEWLRSEVLGATAFSYQRTLMGVSDLEECLYSHCGVELLFPGTLVSRFNSYVGNVRILHRTATYRQGPPHTGYEVALKHEIGRRCSYPIPSGEGVDACIVIMYERKSNVLRGCFVFPEQVLVEQGVFSTTGRADGKTTLKLYPPFEYNLENIRHRQVRATYEWQLPYYIDLSGTPSEVEESRAKFLRIFNDVKTVSTRADF